jgi:hypothetical protein
MCYMYLDIDTEADYLVAEDFKSCRWIYRGWPLQELIAPSRLQFYSRFWLFLGTRQQLAQALHETTKIDLSLLYRPNDEKLDFSTHSVAKRMSWVAERKTTRPEDVAYPMFGLFGVHLSPLYGEGSEKAFLRLQHEILKTSRDLSILAWTSEDTVGSTYDLGALAPTPRCFKGCETIVSFSSFAGDTFVMTNKGLCITVPMIKGGASWTYTALLNCRYEHEFTKVLGIKLRSAFPHEDKVYTRLPVWSGIEHKTTTCQKHPDRCSDIQWSTIYITSEDWRSVCCAPNMSRIFSFKMDLGPSAPNVLGNLKISVPPVGLWDPVKGILRIPGGHLRDMDVCPTVSLLHAKDQIPLFTLSIGRIGWSRRYRSINMPSTGSTEIRMHKTSATIVIDGKRMLLKVSLQDDGILRDQHFYQITLRFERLGRKLPCGVSSQLKTPSVH